MGGQTFRFDKHLMAFLVGKAVDLVFDRRAIARADAFDFTGSGIHRRTVEVRRDDFVSTSVCMSNPATDLAWMLFFVAHERHHRDRRITWLLGHHREIHRLAVDTWRCAGFQATDTQWQFTQTVSQCDRRRITGATAGKILQTDVDKSAEERTGGQHHGIGEEPQTHLRDNTTDLFLLDDQVVSSLLKYPQIRLVFENFADSGFVKNAVGLSAGCTHGRAFTAVQHTKLDATQIGSRGHRAAEGIDFLDQMAFANATDGRVATHGTEGFHVMRQQQGFCPHTC